MVELFDQGLLGEIPQEEQVIGAGVRNRVDVDCQVVPQQEESSMVQLRRLNVLVFVKQLLYREVIVGQAPFVKILDPLGVENRR